MIDSFTADLESEASTRYRRSVSISVNLQALRFNLSMARRCSAGSRLFATIKADAYGHGAVEVAHALSADHASGQNPTEAPYRDYCAAADGFAVVTLDEALELRDSGIASPIMVLQGPQSVSACSIMAKNGLWPVIHDLYQYEWYRQVPQTGQLRAWLKVDTGMGRLGVQPEEAGRLLSANDGINWMGLMTHFACADDTQNPYTLDQLARFSAIDSALPLLRSLANSAAVLAWPQTHSDWNRPGIMLYGCNPLNRPLPEGIELKPAMTVSAPLVSVKVLPAGAGVGYGQCWHCPEQMPVGYAAIGYRDGLPRMLESTATVSIQGHACPIIGRVSMDSIAIDLRGLPHVQVGDTVEIWGSAASIDALASSAGTISYELLTSIRGSRCYINDL